MADISYGAKPNYELEFIRVHRLHGRAIVLARSPHDRVPLGILSVFLILIFG